MKPLAIAIPTYNRADLIGDAIDSILACADRSQAAIHVFDNASTDRTLEVLERYRSAGVVAHQSNVNAGYVGNLNRCIQLADNYEAIAILHSDDVYKPSAVSTILSAIHAYPDAGILYSQVDIVNRELGVIKRGVPMPRSFRAGDEALLRAQSQIPCSSTVYMRGALVATGSFSDRFPHAADEEYNSRIAEHFAIVEMGTVIASYREHPGHLMYKTWLRPDFLGNFEQMRLEMNGRLSRPLPERVVLERVARIMGQECSSLIAIGEMSSARRYARNLIRRSPAAVANPRLALKILLSFLPKRVAQSLLSVLSHQKK